MLNSDKIFFPKSFKLTRKFLIKKFTELSTLESCETYYKIFLHES